MTATFRSWSHTAPIPLVGSEQHEGRLRLKLELTASIDEGAGAAPGPTVQVPVDLLGPGDVVGLTPQAVRKVSPPAGTQDADGEFCAFIDLSAEDLPWRYTPRSPDDGEMVPWLALVAGREGDELGLSPDGTAWLSPAVTTDMDTAHAHCWAHAHTETVRGVEHLVAARLLCPRSLPALADCLAVVVPIFAGDGTFRWTPGMPAAGLPVLHLWRFRTNDAGTFEDLAVRLHGTPPPPGLGERTVIAAPAGGSEATSTAFGALAPRSVAQPPAWSDATIESRVENMLTPAPAAGDSPIVGPPRYGDRWHPQPATTSWGGEINRDPRTRGVAGLGMRAGIDWQHQIVEAAAARLGQTHLARALLRDLTLGVNITRRIAARRLPSSAEGRLSHFGPGLGQVVASAGGTALGAVAGSGSPLSPAMLSAALARLMRPGGPVARASADAIAVGDPGALVAAANVCPDDPLAPLPQPDPIDEPAGSGTVFELLLGSTSVDMAIEDHDDESLSIALEAMGANFRTIVCHEREEQDGEAGAGERCVPVDIEAVSRSLDVLFDPGGAAVDRITGRLVPPPGRWDVPLEVDPDLDLPAWTWLRDHAPEWLLPGAQEIEPDAVVAVRSNAAFVESFLLGLSTQAVAELRWRGVPLAAGSMPMRTFWQHVEDVGTPGPFVDLRPAGEWPEGSALGDTSHLAPGGSGDGLVIVLRSELLRRYPDTVIYLTPLMRIVGRRNVPERTGFRRPRFVGHVTDDTWFIGFDVAPETLGSWFVVLEEPVQGPRFHAPLAVGANGYTVTRRTIDDSGPTSRLAVDDVTVDDGAELAQRAFAPPVRVFLDGNQLAG